MKMISNSGLLKILNYTFKVIEVNEISHGSTEIGQIDHLDQTIRIKKGLSPERKQVTIIHEVLHSIFEQLGYDELHDNEQLINSLSMALSRVINDNNL